MLCRLRPLGICLVLVFLLCFVVPTNTYASNSYRASARLYETVDESLGYTLSFDNAISSFSYGKETIGMLELSGTVNKNTTIDGVDAYAVTDGITVRYSYDGGFHGKDKEDWHLVSDSGKTVAGIPLSKKIEDGVFVIQKSVDLINWENAKEPIFNLFSAKKIEWDNLNNANI